MQAARAGGDVLELFVAATGDVVGEQPTDPPAQVVAGEDRHDDEALHRRAEVAAQQHRELVRLAVEAEELALDLLVVLELELEELDHLHRRTGRAGDGDAAVAVGLGDLLHGPVRDEVARGRPPVARHHDAALEAGGDACGGVGDVEIAPSIKIRVLAGERRHPDALEERRKARARIVTGREERHGGHRCQGRYRSAAVIYWPPFWT